ncbi:glycine oxidase [Ectothiorhodosinus mongolicus]|uniref:Glycine oxidase n=1 Tax=Ectothiorhodosinus mongolicus TaxID=233100 RepID=A0A1R3VXJ6_9GAMM|nr:glycine oxidase ThiO [Ectothiorhodosinus mongolicus]ULX57088.1 glycine oxidase ThiO [Ectothiorhodosinus mongolicus]SIT69860.1 glycine oxidase [Ectothiorhodosinus mongolicus]
MTDCVIVGGGLMGMLSARMLHDKGLNVTVVDKGTPGQESSWAGGGILSPLYPWRYPEPVTRLAALTQGASEVLAQELLEETGLDPEWTQSGLLVIDSEEALTATAWADEHSDIPLHLLHGQQAITAVEPAIAALHNEAIWMPQIAQFRNPRLVKALRASLKHRGIPILADCAVTEIQVTQGKVIGVNTEQGPMPAGQVLVCSGAWSARLVESWASLPVEPVRGQMLAFAAPHGLLNRMVLHRQHYLIPRRDGLILAGSTIEHVGFDHSVTQSARDSLTSAAIDILPALKDCQIAHHWAGLRPGSPNGVPIIGEHADIKGLFINAGHYRNGVVMSWGSCQLLTQLMLGEVTCCDPQPYRYAFN